MRTLILIGALIASPHAIDPEPTPTVPEVTFEQLMDGACPLELTYPYNIDREYLVEAWCYEV